jgi:lipoic acid synthetase
VRLLRRGKGAVAPLDPTEPERVAEAAALLALKHVVVTSVTRDDVPDGGAAHFTATIRAVRSRCDATVEVLTSDFAGSLPSVEAVIDACPDVFNHNVETVPRLYLSVRPQADYARSLGVLRHAVAYAARTAGDSVPSRAITAKSGIMVGVGETLEEVDGVFADLLSAGVRIVTVGQYLRPSAKHLPVVRYVTPEEFDLLEKRALEMGFQAAFSAPFVRSSYHAGEVLKEARQH